MVLSTSVRQQCSCGRQMLGTGSARLSDPAIFLHSSATHNTRQQRIRTRMTGKTEPMDVCFLEQPRAQGP